MAKSKRIFRDKLGRFTSDLRKVKTAQIGKRTYKKKEFVKKLLKNQLKQKSKVKEKPELKEKPKFKLEFKQETYQTQLGKLDGTHTVKYDKITTWFEINTIHKIVNSFKIFYDNIERPKKATDVKFGIILEDKNTESFVSKYSEWTDLIFDEKAIKKLFEDLVNWVNDIMDLIEKYKVDIFNILADLIIMFKVKGHL